MQIPLEYQQGLLKSNSNNYMIIISGFQLNSSLAGAAYLYLTKSMLPKGGLPLWSYALLISPMTQILPFIMVLCVGTDLAILCSGVSGLQKQVFLLGNEGWQKCPTSHFCLKKIQNGFALEEKKRKKKDLPSLPKVPRLSDHAPVWTLAPAVVCASKRGNSRWSSALSPSATWKHCHKRWPCNSSLSQICWRDTNVHMVQELTTAALGTNMENISVTAWREWKTKEKMQGKIETHIWNTKHAEMLWLVMLLLAACRLVIQAGVNPGKLPWKELLWDPWKVGQICAYS